MASGNRPLRPGLMAAAVAALAMTALPSLAIVVVGLIPVLMLSRAIRAKR